MTAALLPELIAELDAAVKAGSPQRGDRILGQVTSLLLSNVDRLGEAQLSVLDDVLVHLIEQAEIGSLAELSRSLSRIEQAPRETVRRLAFHSDPSVAAPVLRNSGRLSENDLIEIAKTLDQQHLLAISERMTLSESLTDVLMRRGDADIPMPLRTIREQYSPNAATQRWLDVPNGTKVLRRSLDFDWICRRICCASFSQ